MTIESSLPYLAPPDLAKAIAWKRLTARDQEEAVGWQLSGAVCTLTCTKGTLKDSSTGDECWVLYRSFDRPSRPISAQNHVVVTKLKDHRASKARGNFFWRVSAVRIRWLTFVKLLVFKCVLWRGRKGRCCVKNTRHAFGSMNRSFHCCDLHLTYVAPAEDAAMSEDLKDGSDPNPTDPKDPMSLSCFRYRGSFNLILSISF